MRSLLQLPRSRSRERSEPETETASRASTTTRKGSEADSIAEDPLFRLGRAIFGGILAFTAVDNLRNLEERVQYADAKDAPAPERSVPAVSSALLAGGLGVALWRRPAAGAAAIAGFLAGTTPVMHDFWNEDDPETKQQELTHFLKNGALFGAALAFMTQGRRRDER
ncbi:DoxX family membrane protein [Halopiger xanaduensis]|uniref:DoxX family protein n=1 Tax=Halopiger xanaduensis (strain DSM 18323 / JCM 14033 / SH-6) TaxID=797210 RepID=F8D8B8_HALXS|nr:DoxX family membrane protein [Halopiger xanaduensis]AEH36904.1 DoxX family protein [Halopiger xanaduensis SH-6]